MASKREYSVLNGVDELVKSIPSQVDEFLSKIRDNCQELLSSAEQEAITIVSEAAQRTKAEDAKHSEELAKWEEEKKRIASTHIFEPMVTLNVGGTTFTTATATLTRFPDTMLGAMFSGRHALTPDKNGAYCIDRDGRHFHEILNFLRGTTSSTQQQIKQRLSPSALEELKVEADFYGVKDLMFPEPFKPAAAVVIQSNAGYNSTVTQGEDELWYILHTGCSGGPTTRQIVKVCDHCGGGFLSYGGYEMWDTCCEMWDSYAGFTTGRTVSHAQPRKTGKCTSCGK